MSLGKNRDRVKQHTMLSRFHAMNRVNAHPTLPQSESDWEESTFVHRGYTKALEAMG